MQAEKMNSTAGAARIPALCEVAIKALTNFRQISMSLPPATPKGPLAEVLQKEAPWRKADLALHSSAGIAEAHKTSLWELLFLGKKRGLQPASLFQKSFSETSYVWPSCRIWWGHLTCSFRTHQLSEPGIWVWPESYSHLSGSKLH